MDPIANPYAPGAGAPPPALVGRDELLERFRVSATRLVRARQTKSLMLIGLRGVGKTVLLDRMREMAEADGIQKRSLPSWPRLLMRVLPRRRSSTARPPRRTG